MAKKDEYYERGRRRYIEEHAHHLAQTAALLDPGPMAGATDERVAARAVALAGALYDALPRSEGDDVADHRTPSRRSCDPGPASEEQP